MFPISCSRSLLMATLGLAACLAVFGTLPALAGTGGGGDMPWDPLLDALVANIGGRTLRNILILAIIGAGIGFYFAAEGSWLRSAFGLVIGFSIAAAAATWGPGFFGVAAASIRTPVPPASLRWFDWASVALRLLTWLAVVYALGWWLQDLQRWWRAPGLPVPGAEQVPQ